jgi:hypothetical protein
MFPLVRFSTVEANSTTGLMNTLTIRDIRCSS